MTPRMRNLNISRIFMQYKRFILKYIIQHKKQKHGIMTCWIDNSSNPYTRAATFSQTDIVVSPSLCSLEDKLNGLSILQRSSIMQLMYIHNVILWLLIKGMH